MTQILRRPASVAPVATLVYTGLYLAAIVAANLSVTAFGPAVTIVNAFLFIGFDLVCRDRLHDAWRRRGLPWKMALLIAAGSVLSYLLNRAALPIAVASCAAFVAASMVDAIAYHSLRHRPWFQRANGSNLAGAAVDSVLFPQIAFGSFLPWIVLGQFAAKVTGGLMWSLVLRRTRTES